MCELAARSGWLWDPVGMAEAVRKREDLCPTAQDNGVALLHPRRPQPDMLAQPCLALGLTERAIPFGGAGGTLTDVFFLICSTEDRGQLPCWLGSAACSMTLRGWPRCGKRPRPPPRTS